MIGYCLAVSEIEMLRLVTMFALTACSEYGFNKNPDEIEGADEGADTDTDVEDHDSLSMDGCVEADPLYYEAFAANHLWTGQACSAMVNIRYLDPLPRCWETTGLLQRTRKDVRILFLGVSREQPGAGHLVTIRREHNSAVDSP